MRDKDAAAILVLKQWLARDRGLRIWHASDEARAGVEAAIRLLEAAGKVDKQQCQDLLDVLIGEDIVVAKGDISAVRQFAALLEALPDEVK